MAEVGHSPVRILFANVGILANECLLMNHGPPAGNQGDLMAGTIVGIVALPLT